MSEEEMLTACVQVDARGPVAERRFAAWRLLKREYRGPVKGAIRRAVGGAVSEAQIDGAVRAVWQELMRDDCRLLREYDVEDVSLGVYLDSIARYVAKRRLSLYGLPRIGGRAARPTVARGRVVIIGGAGGSPAFKTSEGRPAGFD